MVLPLPLNTLANHVTQEKAGWIQDYSLHNVQWNFSGTLGHDLSLGLVRLKASNSRESSHSKQADSGLTGSPMVDPFCVLCMLTLICNSNRNSYNVIGACKSYHCVIVAV